MSTSSDDKYHVGELIYNLQLLILTVRKNFLSSFVTMLMLMALIIVWSARGNISTFVTNHPSREIQAQRVSRSLSIDNKINAVVKEDRTRLNADRGVIRQFYETDESKLSVPSVAVTYINNAPGIDIDGPPITLLPRSYFSDVTGSVWADPANPKCSRLTLADIKNGHYRDILQASGVQLLYTCPITGIDGEPIGMIMAQYLTESKPRPTDDVIFSVLSATSVRVAGYLAAVTAPEEEIWWHKILNV